jgi:hypothetical protein
MTTTRRILLEDHDEWVTLTQSSMADEWPAGDPCPSDREVLVMVEHGWGGV